MAKKLDDDNIYKNTLIILFFSFIALIIPHSTSYEIFGYLIYAERNFQALFLSIFLAMTCSFYFLAIKDDIRKIKNFIR